MSKAGLLSAAITAEVAATLALRAGLDHPAWFVVVAVGYPIAFFALGKLMAVGVQLGVAYGIWCAFGVTATAVLAVPFFGDPLNATMGFGMVVLITGVLIVEVGRQ